MSTRISFDTKEQMVGLAGACFWYWNSFYSFLDNSGVDRTIYQRFPKEVFNKYQVMRNVLQHLDDTKRTDVIDSLISNFYRLKGPIDRDKLDPEKAKSLILAFRDAVGDDPIEAAIRAKEAEKARSTYRDALANTKTKSDDLTVLNARFQELASGNAMTAQQRGFALERLFFDLLHLSEVEHTKPYRTEDGEQIDGHFRFEKFDYLVEMKWIAGTAKQEDLSTFDGKIRGKAQSTRGLFLAAEDFDENAISKFSGDAPRVILMTGEDLALILSGAIPMFDVLKAKIDAIVRHGKIYFPARAIRRLS